MLNPLRYPGSKARFVETIREVFEENGLHGLPIIEPYAGSGSVSLGLLQLGLVSHVTLVERDPLVYSFWKSVFCHSAELIDRFGKQKINLQSWRKARELITLDAPNGHDVIELGAAALFLNRTNFSGIIHGGPIGGYDQASIYALGCRTNKPEIERRIEHLSHFAEHVTVEFGDAQDFIRRDLDRKRIFYYMDPPYFRQGERLYRYSYNHSQHKNLAKLLSRAAFPWVLSYDRHHVIELFYEEFEVSRKPFQYSANVRKNRDELVITNLQLV